MRKVCVVKSNINGISFFSPLTHARSIVAMPIRRALRVEDAILFTFHAKKKCSAISIRQILRVKDVVLKKYTNYRLLYIYVNIGMNKSNKNYNVFEWLR